MQLDLDGKLAIVSGSSAGIGLAIAKALALCGADVVINGRRQETLDQAARAIRNLAPAVNVHTYVGDLSQKSSVTELVERFPRCDVLVNNLGVYAWKDFFAATDEEWDEFVSVNVTTGIRLSRAYMPDMMKNGWGRVIFISSESGLNIPPDMIFYGATKTAQLALARGLAKVAAGTGVTVNSVLPGPTLSDGVETMIRGMVEGSETSVHQAADAFVKESRPSSIIRRTATVTEVANMVAYVASPLSSATTGAALRVEGGIVDSIG